MAQNFDEFDEFLTIRQYFPYQNYTFSHLPIKNLWRSGPKYNYISAGGASEGSFLHCHCTIKDCYGSQFLVHS